MKRCSTLLIEKCKSKSKYNYSSFRMAIIKRSVGKDVEKSESLYILGLCLHLSVSQQLMWEILPLSVIICKS